MAHKHLYPRQRQIEIMATLYTGGLGAYVGMVNLLHGDPPLGWLPLSDAEQLLFAEALITCAFVHAIGIRINGAWWGSPILRVIGMAAQMSLIGWAAFQGSGSSAGYTYSWITVAMAVGVYNAFKDAKKAWQMETLRAT